MKYILFLSLCLFFIACQSPVSVSEVEAEIRTTEAAFNQMVKEEGIKNAFLYFAAEEGMLVRNEQLVEGKMAIANYFDQPISPDVSLTWTPDHIFVSDAGDMAYSFGEYLYSARDTSGEEVTAKGIFRTLWKKQPDGQWRYLVD